MVLGGIENVAIKIEWGDEYAVTANSALAIHIRNISDNEVSAIDIDIVTLIAKSPEVLIKID